MKKSAKGIIYIALCVDDNIMVGKPEAIDEAMSWMGCRVICPVKYGSPCIKMGFVRTALSHCWRRNLAIELKSCKIIIFQVCKIFNC